MKTTRASTLIFIFLALDANASQKETYEPTPKVKYCVEVPLDEKNAKDYNYCKLALLETVNSMEVHRLLEKGHNPNTILDGEGRTRLVLSTFYGQKDIVAELMNFGQTVKPRLDVNICANSGHSALMYASAKGFSDVVMMLLASNANVNAAVTGDPVRMKEQGKSYDHAKGRTGFTPLHFAAFQGSHRIMKLLIDAGADPALRSRTNLTAIDIIKGSGE